MKQWRDENTLMHNDRLPQWWFGLVLVWFSIASPLTIAYYSLKETHACAIPPQSLLTGVQTVEDARIPSGGSLHCRERVELGNVRHKTGTETREVTFLICCTASRPVWFHCQCFSNWVPSTLFSDLLISNLQYENRFVVI